jgi:hypothetical protein
MFGFPSILQMLSTTLVYAAMVACTASASAQESSSDTVEALPRAQDGSSSATPEWRVDMGVPSVGVGVVTDVNPDDEGRNLGIGAHVTVAHRSGHGVRVGLAFSLGGLGGTERRNSSFVDAGYVHRFRLVGDDRLGLGLDVGGGLSVGSVIDRGYDCSALNGVFCMSIPDPRRVADGAHLGINAGASFDLRLFGFTMGLDVRGRAAAALERNDMRSSALQAEMLASIYLGFGFY